MTGLSHIEWTDATWNPVTGCTKVSQGCKHCYAERMAKRLHAMGQARYKNAFALTVHNDLINLPRGWTKPRRIFVNSMSDLFHHDVPSEFIAKIFDTIVDCPQHTFQILTKRSERLKELSESLPWPKNLWMGVSVESSEVLNRVDDLSCVPAAVRFLSVEPLLGPITNLPVNGIDWVIVGGESGPGARPMEPAWVDSILEQCINSNVAFFFKQWGGTRKDLTGRLLHGRTYDEEPIARLRYNPTPGPKRLAAEPGVAYSVI